MWAWARRKAKNMAMTGMRARATVRLRWAGDDEGHVDATCLLRHASLSQCSEAEQLAYFINLYHLMTQHAFLVLGPPASPQQWKIFTFWNSVTL